MEPTVLCRVSDGVAELTLNRPEKLNALTAASFVELRGHLDALAGRDDLRVVVLAGAGRSFCAGHDLAAIVVGDGEQSRYHEAETIDMLEEFPVPTIAKVHGHCFTGGLELALGCDLLIAAESAQFADTHTAWGLSPVWGMSVRLPERIGRARAKELTFTGRRIDGKVAERIGLVTRVVPDNSLDAEVAKLVAEIVRCSAGANRIAKKLFADSRSMGRKEALYRERDMPYGIADDAEARLNPPSVD
jgi:enoyl-CoA hydratase